MATVVHLREPGPRASAGLGGGGPIARSGLAERAVETQTGPTNCHKPRLCIYRSWRCKELKHCPSVPSASPKQFSAIRPTLSQAGSDLKFEGA